MRIRIHLFTLMRIRILLSMKVIRICDLLSSDRPQLHFEPTHFQCERPRPSTALLWTSRSPDLTFRIQLFTPVSKTNANPDPQPWLEPSVADQDPEPDPEGSETFGRIRSGTETNVSDPDSDPDLNPDLKLDPKKICKKELYFQVETSWFHMIIPYIFHNYK